jgi:hypothetical protein
MTSYGVQVISKDEAERVGDAIVEQARLVTLSRRKRSRVRIPLLCRCTELNSLPPSLQADVVVQAGLEVMRSWRFILAVLAWVVVWSYAFWTLTISANRTSSLVFPFVTGCWTVAYLLRGVFLRSRVRASAAKLQGAVPTAISSGD